MTRSRIVALLRVILPLTALALLSVLFLLGRKPEPGGTIPYANIDPREVAERQMATQPAYAGVTQDGAQVNITGNQAMPGGAQNQGSANAVRMTLRAKDGRASDISAGRAAVDGDLMVLQEGVRMTTADGWVVTAPEFHASPSAGTLNADAEVNVRAPFGNLTAAQMELRPLGDGTGDHVLDLSGGVRLIYQP